MGKCTLNPLMMTTSKSFVSRGPRWRREQACNRLLSLVGHNKPTTYLNSIYIHLNMGGGNKRRATQKQDKPGKQLGNNSQSKASESEDGTSEEMAGQVHNETLQVGLASIIKDLKQELQNELCTFKDKLKKEIKEEMSALRQELKRKLTEHINELQAQKATLTEAQGRVAELEEKRTDAGELMVELVD